MLRDDGYKYGLPYWNSGFERGLPSPAHSAIFTTKELGVSIIYCPIIHSTKACKLQQIAHILINSPTGI